MTKAPYPPWMRGLRRTRTGGEGRGRTPGADGSEGRDGVTGGRAGNAGRP
jgi:hypothetical protein